MSADMPIVHSSSTLIVHSVEIWEGRKVMDTGVILFFCTT